MFYKYLRLYDAQIFILHNGLQKDIGICQVWHSRVLSKSSCIGWVQLLESTDVKVIPLEEKADEWDIGLGDSSISVAPGTSAKGTSASVWGRCVYLKTGWFMSPGATTLNGFFLQKIGWINEGKNSAAFWLSFYQKIAIMELQKQQFNENARLRSRHWLKILQNDLQDHVHGCLG